MSESKFRLTNRERDIMNILWESSESLTASEIAGKQEELSINTVQALLKKLLKKELIKIDRIVYSGTVLCRSYRPAISPEVFETQKYVDSMKDIRNQDFSASYFVAALLEQEKDSLKALSEIEELEKLLAKKRSELQKEESKQ